MALSLRESRAVADMAVVLNDFLPGSGHQSWTNHVSFKSVSQKVGVGDYWQPGSKTPMITALLSKTLEFQRGRFEPLILEVVRAGIAYRQKKGIPVTPEEIKQLNGLVLEVGFRFPDLWDNDFLLSLETTGTARATAHVEKALADQKLRANAQTERLRQQDQLKNEFFTLRSLPPQKAGFAFEKILNRLFSLHGLAPREPFRVVGEQIDGSFDLDHETYLVEAKWEKDPIPEAPLLVFRGKIEGKSAYTRGAFISLNGVSTDARTAISCGKQPTFFVLDGHDLAMVLAGDIGLADFLRQRRRILAEEGAIVVPYQNLWRGSRARSRSER